MLHTLSEILGHTKVSLTLQLYAHSTMETKVEAMNCIEKYLWFRLRCGQKSGQNLYIVYKHESFYTRILQKNAVNTKKDLHLCKSLRGA